MKKIIYSAFLWISPLLALSQVVYDFESGDIQGWLQVPVARWEISETSPISGLKSLKHAGTGTDKDRISIPLPSWNGDAGTVTWRFKLRHGYNPSSSNSWGVFIISDKDANGMLSTGSPNGYAVGVNLTGFDDLLKLYRVSNGTFSPIIASTLNWEQDIKTTGVGAIEVSRKPDGTFTLKASPAGSFLGLQPYGTISDITFPFGGNFGVLYTYTSSAAGKLWLDEISINYNPINTNDRDALVLDPDEQIPDGEISSLAIDVAQSVNVFRFRVHDQGTADGLPTRVTKLRFVKVQSPSAAVWPDAIAGVKLMNSQEQLIPILATYILDNEIEIELDPSSMSIPNASISTFTLAIFLKSGSITDGETIQLKVEASEHGWESDYNGSGFTDTFPDDIVSDIFTIRALPTHLFFIDYPKQVVINQPFSISAYAGDISGNLSSQFASNVSLSLNQGSGNLTPAANLNASAIQGIATWSGIAYSARDSFKLQASSPNMQGVIGNLIAVTNDNTTFVQPLANQPVGKPISSLINTPGQAVEVMRFRVLDGGNNDGVPTYIKQITLKRPSGENLASFSRNIAGVVIRVGETIIPCGSPSILAASITIPFEINTLVVPDGERIDVSVWVYLNEKNLEDGKELRFIIDSQNHGFTAYSDGSVFSETFLQNSQSNPFTVDVKATRVTFSTVPQFVGLGEAFSVGVSAVDAAGNLDVDATASVTLSKNSGDGWLTIPTATTEMNGGVVSFNGLMYYQAQPFTLLASTPEYDDAVSPLIYCADRTSTILLPLNPIPDGTISSLAVDTGSAVEVFRFRVRDVGNTDGLPTYVTQMAFQSFGLESDAKLNRTIGGVLLEVNNQVVEILSTTITSNRITITFDPSVLIVNDTETIECKLKAFLQKGGLADGATINLHVPPANHGWTAATIGSGFPVTFTAGVVGPIITVDVTATQLAFTQQPFGVSPSTSFTLEVAATDIYGNVDINSAGNTGLSLDYGTGSFTVDNQLVPFVNGVGEWTGVSMNETGVYRFKATSEGSQSFESLSQPIWNGDSFDCLLDENFDLGYPSTFPTSTAWNVSSVSPIDGEMSLKHALTGVAGESRLAIPFNISNLGSGPVEWSFVMRNGNWDPSADNAFWFVLASDSASIRLGDFNGYAVGVNLSGTTDLLTLWRVTMGAASQAIIQTTFDWNESETVAVRVTRTPKGEWSLYYQPKFNESVYTNGGSVYDTRHTKVVRCGPAYKFGASRAGELWLDNLKVCATSYPPIIQSVNALSLTSVDVFFSESVNQDDAAIASHFAIRRLDGTLVTVLGSYPSAENGSKVTLRTQLLPIEDLWLFVEGIKDADGLSIKDSTTFGVGATGAFGSIIINEIMAKPSATMPLPELEYIELYNRTANSVSLSGWRLRASNNYYNIPNVTIEPNGYIILCTNNAAPLLSEYGVAVGVTSFPALVNSGMFLAIYDNLSQLMSWVDYSESWYGSDAKKAGGYSLERIDVNNLVEGQRNWTGSDDPSGGTPGRVNSVSKPNQDNISPRILELKVLSPTELEITYSEPMDYLSVTSTENYTISMGVGKPLWATSLEPRFSKVSLTLSSALTKGNIYEMCFDQGIVDFSSNPLVADCIPFALPDSPLAGDLVINEVLFNPYAGGVDFVEIFNKSDKVFDVNKIWIANRNRTTGALNEFYVASDTTRFLFPQEYAVLSVSPKQVEQFYFVENPSMLIWSSKIPAYPSDNGYVLVMDEFGEILDEFYYTDKMHFKLLSDVKGVSLERINPDLPSNDASSWQSAAQNAGFATPTAKNSQYRDPEKAEDFFEIAEKVFSPDGDGYNDVLLISYNMPDEGYTANIMVFDSKGRRVRRLASNLTLGTSGTIKWDGVTDENRKASVGAYVVYIEVFTLKNNVKQNLKQYKKTCVVATRFGG